MKLEIYVLKDPGKKKNKKHIYPKGSSENSTSFALLEKWLHLNFKENFSFRSKLECYLKNMINSVYKHASMTSRFFLLNLRVENMGKIFFYYSKIEKKLDVEFYSFLIPFNSLIIIPIKKLIFFNIKKIIEKKIYQLEKQGEFTFKTEKWIFNIKKKNYRFYNFNFSQIENPIKWKKSINFVSYLTETITSFFESFSFFQGISTLITIERNFYCVVIMVYYIKTFLSRTEKYKKFFSKTKTVGGKKRKINFKNFKKNKTKIDPMMAAIFRFDPSISFVFRGIISKFFRILSSKNNLPFLAPVRLVKYPELFRKKINYKNDLFLIKETTILCYQNNNFQKNFKQTRPLWKSSFVENNFFVFFFLFKKAKDFHNEQLGSFQITQFNKIFQEGSLDIWLNPFLIQFSDLNFGSIEVIPNSITFHHLHENIKPSDKKIMWPKKKNSEIRILKKKCINFIESLAGYSLLCFFVQLKDRHNNNILINSENRIIHIDFGFILGDFPGFVNLEADFFKLTKEFFAKLGGQKTEEDELFKELMFRGFFLIRKNMGKLLSICRRTLKEKKRKKKKKQKLLNFQKRFKISAQNKKLIKFTFSIINKSFENWKTIQYDRYQFLVNEIA